MVVQRKSVLMLGTSLASPGGMTSVVRTLKEAGLFDTCQVDYLATYESGAIATQLRVMARAVVHLLSSIFGRSVAVVHAHSASRGSFWRKSLLCSLAKLCGIPYLFHIHSGEFPYFFNEECGALAKWWARRTLTCADAVICLSPSWAEQIRAIAPSAKTVAIGNPVAIPRSLPSMRPSARNVLFLGRLRKKKGVFDLVHAIPEILRHCPDLRFTLAGDEGIAELKELAAKLGVAESIDFPGWVEGKEKDTLLQNADIFVLPSYFEGLPVGILEAMAMGVPVVATNVGGIPDLVTDQEHALLTPPGDPTSLAAAIIKLGSDPELRQRLRNAAFERAETQYALPRVVEQLATLYDTHQQISSDAPSKGELPQ